MAKKILAVAMAFALVFSMSACGNSSSDEETLYDYDDLSQYVTLGDYIGVEVERVDPEEVTDESVETEIQSILEENATTDTVTEGTVESGDTVNIDYTGKIDGKEFDGGSATGSDLTIGSGAFIDGFEDGLIGKNIGDEVTLNLTFPDDYDNADVAGKDVVFTVKINSKSVETVPELTDDFVKTVSTTSTTVDEYKAEIKEQLVKEAEETAKQDMESAAFQTVYDNCKILEYPEKEVTSYEDDMRSYYEQYAESYDMEFADFLEMAGITEDEFNEEAESYAQEQVGQDLVMYAIVRAEGLELTDDEYEEGAQEYVDQMGYEDIAALEEEYTKETIESSLQWEKFLEFLYDNANIVEPSADSDADAAADADASADAADTSSADATAETTTSGN